ncbi:hypothetical protein KQI63_05125 [bacterium]|nr:hypothetical protein [bacterium]
MMKPDLKEAFDQSGFSGTPDYPEWIPAPIRFSYPVYKWELRPASLSIRVGLLPRFSAGVMAYRSPGYRAKGIGRETERLFADHASLVGMISLNPIPASHRYKAFRTETWLLFGAGITSATANLHVTGVESDDPPVDKSVETIVPHLLAGGEAHIHLGAIVSMVVRGSFVIPQRMDLPKVRNGEKELVAHSVNLTTFHVTGGLLFRLWFLGG